MLQAFCLVSVQTPNVCPLFKYATVVDKWSLVSWFSFVLITVAIEKNIDEIKS
jgi:hypothetical protein